MRPFNSTLNPEHPEINSSLAYPPTDDLTRWWTMMPTKLAVLPTVLERPEKVRIRNMFFAAFWRIFYWDHKSLKTVTQLQNPLSWLQYYAKRKIGKIQDLRFFCHSDFYVKSFFCRHQGRRIPGLLWDLPSCSRWGWLGGWSSLSRSHGTICSQRQVMGRIWWRSHCSWKGSLCRWRKPWRNYVLDYW